MVNYGDNTTWAYALVFLFRIRKKNICYNEGSKPEMVGIT